MLKEREKREKKERERDLIAWVFTPMIFMVLSPHADREEDEEVETEEEDK
jgi:hypothetical protein